MDAHQEELRQQKHRDDNPAIEEVRGLRSGRKCSAALLQQAAQPAQGTLDFPTHLARFQSMEQE
ncbi:MAG: hypothetical protein AAFN13_17675, partial [Bacteroidota bacterium]